MENLTIERIKTFMNAENLNANALSKAISMPQTTVNDYITYKRKCALALVDGILSNFPTLSAEWLLRGTGEMYLTEDKGKPSGKPQELKGKPHELTGKPQELTGKPQEPKTYTGDTSDKDELIDSLKARIAEQENYIADLRFMARLDKKQ